MKRGTAPQLIAVVLLLRYKILRSQSPFSSAHPITQRGNRGQQVFFDDGGYAACIELLSEWRGEFGVQIWS